MVNNSCGSNTSGNLFQTTLANSSMVAADSSGQLIVGTPVTPFQTLIQQQTASTSASIEFVTGVTGYSYYILEYFDATFDTNNITLEMQFSTDAGATWQGTNYDYENIYNFAGSAITNVQNGTSQAFLSLGLAIGDGSTNASNGTIRLYSLGSSVLYKKIILSTYSTQQGQTTGITTTGGGTWAGATVVNGIQLFMNLGNILTGTFRLYGVT